MKILKYKKLSNGRYKLELDDGGELQLYEEVILKYELLLTGEITSTNIDSINAYNNELDVYYTALKSLKSRFRSSCELKKLLLLKQYPSNYVEKAISKLEKQGYLNDRSFARSYINNQIITSSKGPDRIIRDLMDKGVDKKIIEEEICLIDEQLQLERINKIIMQSLKSNRNKGGVVLKNKIITNLINSGYSYEVINKTIGDYDFFNNEDIAKREYDKLYKRLSKKYSGVELEYKIKEKLYQKGLKFEK